MTGYFGNPTTITLVGGQRITNTHLADDRCWEEGCSVHNPTKHHMSGWPQNYRDPRVEMATMGLHPGLMERVCEHGVGHPDPDHMRWYASCHTKEETRDEGIHGCDGCCSPPAPGVFKAVARRIKDEIIKDQNDPNSPLYDEEKYGDPNSVGTPWSRINGELYSSP